MFNSRSVVVFRQVQHVVGQDCILEKAILPQLNLHKRLFAVDVKGVVPYGCVTFAFVHSCLQGRIANSDGTVEILNSLNGY